MTEVAHRSRELQGFTLFYHPGRGWQMSVRRKDEPGWDVKIIPDDQAAAILGILETSGHPDGPWIVSELRDLETDLHALAAMLRALTEVLNALAG